VTSAPARRLVLLVITAGLFAAGCGSSSGSGTSTVVPASPEASPSSSIAGVRSLDFTEQQWHLHFLGPLRYVQSPPMGGAHSPVPINCGVYTTTLANESAVHDLEHGAVWLTYKTGVDPAPLAALTSKNQSYTMVSPYPTQASPVVATAWGLQLAVDSPTDPRLAQFVKAFVANGLGGEKGARCAGATPEQAAELVANPPQQNTSAPPDPADHS
jgi:hypothetical protein